MSAPNIEVPATVVADVARQMAKSSYEDNDDISCNPNEYSREAEMEGKHVKVENVFKGPHGHDGGMGGLAGLAGLAGLLNQGGHHGHEGGLASALPLLLAGRADHNGFGFGAGGFGAGLVGGVLGGLLFNRRGGFGGDGDGVPPGQIAVDTVNLQALNAIQAAIPTTALQTQNAMQQGFATTLLAGQQAAANTKDAIQAGVYALSQQINTVNQNVLEQGCQTRAVVLEAQNAITNKIDQNTITALAAKVARLESHGHARDSEINVTQNVNQQQAQAQAQLQSQNILGLLNSLICEVSHTKQIAQATNQNIIAGNSGAVATGPQTANPTNVNTR